jgi:Flp pilus assembly protein TadD
MPIIPANVSGPVFLSASEISGPLWRGDDANPYVGFRKKRPAALIAGSILLFEGQIDLSAASAITHESASLQSIRKGEFARALAEAEAAISLAPNSPEAHAARGNVFAKMNRNADAAQEFELARQFAGASRSTQ